MVDSKENYKSDLRVTGFISAVKDYVVKSKIWLEGDLLK